MSVNKVILVGHLGKDPEVRHLEGGVSVASFTLATSESYTRNGERVDQTEWHNIVCWRGLADVAEKYLQKGKLVYVEGKLRTRSWDDKEGNKRYTTEIVADNFTMLGRKSDNTDQGQGGYSQNQGSYEKPENKSQPMNNPSTDDTGDDLPF